LTKPSPETIHILPTGTRVAQPPSAVVVLKSKCREMEQTHSFRSPKAPNAHGFARWGGAPRSAAERRKSFLML
jgi:hypothetical protein